MKVQLKKQNQTVIDMELQLYACGLFVKSLSVINGSLLPPALMPIQKLDNSKQAAVVSRWVSSRTMPDYRTDLDSLLLSLYGYPQFRFGRMHPYKYTAAALAYFRSGFDDYWVTPLHAETVCHVYEDQRLWNLYTWLPAPDNSVFTENPAIHAILSGSSCKLSEPVFNGCFQTASLTIPSSRPSWWDGNRLIQQLHGVNDYRNALRFQRLADNYHACGRRIVTDEYFITEFFDPIEVAFLTDLLLFPDENLKNNGYIRDTLLGKEGYERLNHFLGDADQEDVHLSANEVGIDITSGQVLAIF